MLNRSATVRRPASPRRCAQRGVAQQLDDRVGERGGVTGRNEAPVDAIGHDLGNAADGAGDDRDAAGHGLDQRDALRLAQ